MRFIFIVAFVFAALVPAPAGAQTSDTVRLADGGIVRGTVLDFAPGDHVTVELMTGEVRTYRAGEFLDVLIGPSTPAMVATPPATIAPPRDVAYLSVSGDSEGLSLHRVAASAVVPVWDGRSMSTTRVDVFELICRAPCDVEVVPGSYELGVAPDGGSARRADHDDLRITAGSSTSLSLEYDSREGVRIVGWVVFTGSVLAGMGVILGGIFADDLLGYILGGSVLAGVGMLVAIPMIALQDHADVRVGRALARFLIEGARF